MLCPPRSWYPKAPKLLSWLAWRCIRLLGFILGIRSKGLEALPKKGPCLLLVPHLNFMDAPFLLTALPRPPRFIADDFFVFKNPLLAWLMWLGRTVPVNRQKPDVRAVRQYLRLLADGELCVLFPEGARSLSGKVLPPMMPAVKLISKLKVPVHLCVIEGAYDAWPRWDPIPRYFWGAIKVTYAGIFREGESQSATKAKQFWWQAVYDSKKKIDTSAERNTIQNAMAKVANAQSEQVKLKRWRRAQAIPNMLFCCPLCAKPNGLAWNQKSQKLLCESCGAGFSPEGSNLRLKTQDQDRARTLSDWFDLMVKNLGLKPNKELVVAAKIKTRVEPSVNLLESSARLDWSGLALRLETGQTLRLPLASVARGDAKGTSVIELTYQGKIISLHADNFNLTAWLILARRLAGWKNYFSA